MDKKYRHPLKMQFSPTGVDWRLTSLGLKGQLGSEVIANEIFGIPVIPPSGTLWGKVKTGGVFVTIIDRKIKVGGTFVSALGLKVKTGGVFVDLTS